MNSKTTNTQERKKSIKKIFFDEYNDLIKLRSKEEILAEIVDIDLGIFRLKTPPFRTCNLAKEDIVRAVFDNKKQCFVFKDLLSSSGNSNFTLYFTENNTSIEKIRNKFKKHGCFVFDWTKNISSIHYPFYLEILPVKNLFDELKANNLINIITTCISKDHQFELKG